METTVTTSKATALPLSQIFDGGWDVFIVDAMDEKTVEIVLKNSSPPQNAAHLPTLAGIKKAAQDFCDVNAIELYKAVQLLEGT